MKRKITIKPADYKKVHATLKKLELKDASLKINGLPLSHFLLANTSFDDHADLPEIRTKRIILQIAGDASSKPEDLKDNIKLRINLLFGDDEYSLLQTRLNSLVKEYKAAAGVSENETDDCTTVGDCTTLVNAKI